MILILTSVIDIFITLALAEALVVLTELNYELAIKMFNDKRNK